MAMSEKNTGVIARAGIHPDEPARFRSPSSIRYPVVSILFMERVRIVQGPLNCHRSTGKKKILQLGALPREKETWDENLSHDFPGLCGGRSKPDPVEKSNGTGSFDTMQSPSGV